MNHIYIIIFKEENFITDSNLVFFRRIYIVPELSFGAPEDYFYPSQCTVTMAMMCIPVFFLFLPLNALMYNFQRER